MKPGDMTEFFFAGAGAMPGLLMVLGDPGLGVIVMVGLLIAACVVAMADPQAPFRTVPPPERGAERRRRG